MSHLLPLSHSSAAVRQLASRGGKLDGASSSSSHHDMSSFQINSSLYQLYAPEPPLKADIDIFFFHGLLLGDPLDHVAHTTTWRSLDKKEEIWPKCWLPSDYSLARVITVAYDAYTKTSMTRGRMDLHLIGESLLSDIILERKIEGSLRPLVLVGHCFGGLVIKQVCLHAKRSLKDERLNNMFLSNIKGICFYSTPHHGMEGLDHLVKHGSPLANLIHALNTESARLHESFDELWRFKFRHWDIISICETQPSDERSSVLVPEGSSRYGTCIPVAANHFTVCRPIDKQSTNYQLLIKLVTDCSVKGKITQALEVPEIIVGRESAIDDAMETLQKHAFICFSGTGGVGKTTTAKILFNRLCAQFDFTCFLSDVKLRGNTDEIREKAKRSIRCEGREVEHLKWDEVRGSKLLLVFDDISKDDHLKLLKELAKDNGNPDSRFIATSRDGDCVRLFERAEKIHVQIQSLDILGYEDASRLFMFYIGLKPKNVTENTVKQIVQACDGLPLLLEVMGKYLGGVQEKKIWMSVPAILHSWDNVMPLEEAVWKKLQISFDNLGSEEQEMFLDVATCFSGIRWRDWLERLGFGEHSDFVGDHWKRIVETAMTAWGSRHRGAEVRLNTLVDRSLVQIRTEGTERVFSMHEHLRAMGQRIAREKSRNVTWPPAEADLPLLRQHRDKKAGNRRFCCWGRALPQLDVQYVRVPATIEASINQHPSGTILFCDHCKVSGIQLPAETTTLLWERTSKQAVVSLPTGVFRVTWKEPIMPRRPQEIKIIQDEGFREICEELVVLELSGHDDSDAESILWVNARISLRNLESLTLHYCRLEQSSGSWLQRCLKLRRLSVISCCRGVQFLHLVKTVGQLTNLEQLKITEKKDTDPFSDVVEFTQQLSTNEVLEIVEIEDTDSLDLGRYELQSDFFMLPDSFGNMSSLTHLSLESKLHRALPKSFGNLENLSKLSLSCPSLQTLPDSFGDLGCLSSLDLLSDELQKLPSSFESLTSLKSLRLKCSKLQRLPESLLNLTHLEELHFHECKKLEVLPGWIWDLGNLRKLKFPVCGDLRKVPDSLRRLIHLETLWCSFPVGSAASSEQEREDLRESVQEFGKLSQPLLADLSFRKRFAYEIKFRSVLWFERRSKDFTDLELEQKQENFVASLERMKYIRTW
ncbi:hypothetical protein R1sor_024022 [Riccia sorocarpa]|uniref:NB-ARC domain-containing protein n=1 Tax=Riccia sorocarpa TaxID=122646 RepID=A0ABD3GQV1_9MARC